MLVNTIGHGLGQKVVIILGSNQCAGSLPELGVIVNDRQWVISELPQLGQTLSPGVCGVGRRVAQGQARGRAWGAATVVGAPVWQGNGLPSTNAFPSHLPES